METIYIYNGVSRLTIPVTDSAERSHSLQQHNYVKLVWKSAENTPISANAYIEYEGQVFYALDDYFPTHKDGIYEYDIEFHAIEDTFNRPLFFRYVDVLEQTTGKTTSWKEIEWSLNGNLKTIADIVITCLNRAYDNAYFELPTDSYTDTLLMSYSFSGNSIADALSTIAEQNETEWWLETTTEYVDGKRKYILHFDKCEIGTTIELNDHYTEDANGVWQSGGLKSVSQSGNTNIIPQKLYVYGSERNIIKKTVEEETEGGKMNVSYDKKLRLPSTFPNGTKEHVIESAGVTLSLNDDSSISIGGINNHFEKVKIFDEVYPKMDMEVTAVSVQNPNSENPIYWLKGDRLKSITTENPADNSINPGKLGLLIEGCTLMCTFTSGLLNGREFECAWRESSAEIALISIDENDVQIPSGVYKPNVGDTFILWNLAMPQSSITIAQNELCVEAINYIEELVTSITETDCTTEAEATRISGLNTKIKVGQRISVNSNVFRNGRLSSRIIKYSYKLTTPYDVNFTLASSRQTGRLATLENMIADVTHEVHATGQVQRAISRRQWHDTEEMMSMLDSIQKQMVVVGDENNAFGTTCSLKYNSDTKQLLVSEGYVLHQSFTDNDFNGQWNIDSFTRDMSAIDPDGKTPFYVFFVCPKSKGTAEKGYTDVASALPMYDDYYVFILGILSSEFEGKRAFNQTNGITSIAGGNVTTNVIQDPGQRLIVDFANATITARNGATIKGAIQFEKGEGENDLGTAIEDLLNGVQSAQQGVKDANDAIDNIRFGGMNLIGRVSMGAQNTTYFSNTIANEQLFGEEVREVTKIASGTPPIVAHYITAKAGVPYVASVYVKNSSNASVGSGENNYYARILFRNVQQGVNLTDVKQTSICNEWTQIYTTYVFDKDITLNDQIGIYVYTNYGASGTTYASCLKLQEGNRPTEGFEATTNDIAEVETKANAVSTALTKTQNTLANSLEDGYIDKDEQVRLKEVLSALDGEFNELTKEYEDVIGNQYLIDSSKLQEAYAALNTAHTNYRNIINRLLGISVTTYKVKISDFSYKDNLESKVTAYYQALPTLVNDLAQAQSAIQEQLDKNAQEYANNIQVGGVNLVPFNDIALWTGSQVRERPKITITANSSYQGGVYIPASYIQLNTEYVLSFKIKKTSGSITKIGGHHAIGVSEVYIDGKKMPNAWNSNNTITDDTNEHYIVVKFKQTASSSDNKLYIQPNRNNYTTAFTCVISEIQLEVGNKATAYTLNDADRIEARENLLTDAMIVDLPIATGTYGGVIFYPILKPNTEYTFSIESIVLKTGSVTPQYISFIIQNSSGGFIKSNHIPYVDKKLILTFTTPNSLPSGYYVKLYSGHAGSTTGVGYMAFGVKLAEGNVYTGWEATPAEQQALITLNNAMKGSTDIIGGLVMTNLIGMKGYGTEASQIKAGISGLNENNNLRFWAGSTAWSNANIAPFRVYDNGEVYAGNFFGFNGAFEINSSNFKQVCEYINDNYIWATIKYELTGANIYLGDLTAIKEELGNEMICFVFPSKANYVGSTITYFNSFGYAIGSGNDVLPYSICNTNNFMNTLNPETSLSGVGSINKGITDANGNYYRWSLVFSYVPYQIPTAWCQMIAMPIKVVSGTQIPSEFKEFIISGTYSGSLVSPYLTATTDCVILRWMFKYLNYK